MEDKTAIVEKRLRDRSILISNIERYIEESIYYRTHFSELHNTSKSVLYNFLSDKGRVNIK